MHSGGIEEAVASSLVTDIGTLRAFLGRRIRSHGLVTASLAVAVHSGTLSATAGASGDTETDARTPAPAARRASRAQGRGLVRLARRIWPEFQWDSLGPTPHLAVAAGAAGAAGGLAPEHTALSVVYTTMTGSATAAQRLLALDPGDVAAVTFELSQLCEQTAHQATERLADLSDPLLDVLAQRHLKRERPLFAS